MTVEIKANEIKNETIAKLTRDEIGKLGLLNIGVYTYKGTLKCRVKGLKTTMKTEYAIRCYNKIKDEYEEFYPVLIGCDFFK